MKVTLITYQLSVISIIISIKATETVYLQIGAQHLFKCPYRKLSTNNLIWSYTNNSGTSVPISDGKYIISQYRDRVNITGDHSVGEYNLQLSGIQESDEGVYVCSVNNGGVLQKGYIHSYIKDNTMSVKSNSKTPKGAINNHKPQRRQCHVPPSGLLLYDVTKNRIIGTEGQNLTINCTATAGKPPPEIKLTVSGTSTTGTQTVGYMIPVLQRSHDKQIVTCKANSSALDFPMSKSASLYLYLKPLTPTFNRDQIIANETQQLTVSCTSVGSRPAAAFNWKLKGVVVTTGITQQNIIDPASETYTVISTLTYNVDRSYNKQLITCGVTHRTVTGSLKTIKTVLVQYAPDVVVSNVTFEQQNTTRTIRCTPSGNPSIYTYYRWQHRSKYGELVRELDGSQNGVLKLPSVPESQRYQDSGEYVCTVSNGIGDVNGALKKTESGYLTLKAQPVFTLDNNDMETRYGQIGKNRDIHVFVYSVPKHTSVTWLKGNRRITASSKYSFIENAMIVQDYFNTTKVKLDGYKLSLTIRSVENDDFDIYMIQLSNGFGKTVQHQVKLEFGGAPQTPNNFSVTETTETSIEVEWDPGFGGGLLQTIHLQYRKKGSDLWLSGGTFNSTVLIRQKHLLTGLQHGTVFELRLFSENNVNQSLPTDIKRASTKTLASHDTKSGAQLGGIVGGLMSIIIVLVIAVVLLIKRNRGLVRLMNGNKTTKSNRQKNKAYHTQENEYEDVRGDRTAEFQKENVNSPHLLDLSSDWKKVNHINYDTRTGEIDCGSSVNTYEMLDQSQDQHTSNPNMYDDLTNTSDTQDKEYVNVKIFLKT